MKGKSTSKKEWRRRKYWKSQYATKKEREILNNREPEEYVKVHMQSTPEKIDNFRRLLELCQELGMCEVMNFSDIFPNRDTNKYFRAYSDVIVRSVDEMDVMNELKEGVDNE